MICISSYMLPCWHAVRKMHLRNIEFQKSSNLKSCSTAFSLVGWNPWFPVMLCKLVEKSKRQPPRSSVLAGGAAAALDGDPREVKVSWGHRARQTNWVLCDPPGTTFCSLLCYHPSVSRAFLLSIFCPDKNPQKCEMYWPTDDYSQGVNENPNSLQVST